MIVEIAGPVVDKLRIIAAVEGLTVEQLALDACGLFVEAYAHRPVTMTNAAAAPALTASSSLDAGVELPAVVEKRRPGRPRKAVVRDASGDRCFVCDHTQGEHCGENGRCLSARCACTEFT